MKYYILSAILFCILRCLFQFDRGDHELLSSELTVIIQGIPLTDAVSCVFIIKAELLDCTRVSQSVSIIYYLVPTCAR